MNISQFQSLIEEDWYAVISGRLTFDIVFNPEYVGIAYNDNYQNAELTYNVLKLDTQDIESIEKKHGTHEVIRTLMRAILTIGKTYKPLPSEVLLYIYREDECGEWRWVIRNMF